MKKIVAITLAVIMLVMTFAFAGCGDKKAEPKLMMLEEPYSSEQYGIGFKKGNTELRDAVQAAVYKLFADGKVAEVAAKYADFNLDQMICLDSANATTFDVANASAEFKARKTFTVGFDAEYPPYGYMDDSGKDYTGFDLDLAALVCEIYGWELVKKPIIWDAKDTALDSGEIDVIWNGFTMTGRESEYEWTDAYIDNSIVIVVLDDSGIKTTADLKDKVVETQTDSSAQAALDEDTALTETFKEYKLVKDYNTAIMDLKTGAADAVVIDIGVAQYQIANNTAK